MACKPSDEIGHVSVRERVRRRIRVPVMCTLFGCTGEDKAAEPLVTNESEITWIDERTGDDVARGVTTGAIRAMALPAVGDEGLLSLTGISVGCIGVERRGLSIGRILLSPCCDHAIRQRGNLLLGQHAASRFSERRHRGIGHAVGGDALGIPRACNGEIHRIVQRDCCAILAVHTMAGRAVLRVQRGEVEYLFGMLNEWGDARFARSMIAAGES